MRGTSVVCLLLLACTGDTDTPPGWSFPAATAGPELRGPGGPEAVFDNDELYVNCGVLEPGENSFLHHNLVVPYRGHLFMPWAPEFGIRGGVSLFDMTDPCRPVKVGEGESPTLRESHAVGFAHLPEGDPHAGDWAVLNLFGGGGESGIQFWDLSDLENPMAVTDLRLPGVTYPDAYARVSLSVFWAYPYVYVAAADNGVFVVDATSPLDPEIVNQFTFDSGLRAGSVFAMGTTLLVTSAEQSNTALLDISDPENPQPVPGGTFNVVDNTGVAREYYFGNRAGPYALFARKESGGGPIVYDISDRSAPTFLADFPIPGSGGGYVFYDEGFLFTGDSNAGHVVDARDMTDLELDGTGLLSGDLDTLTPYGNVGILSVDDEAEDGIASAVMPWTQQPDQDAPEVMYVDPVDGTTGVAVTARVGFGLNEMIEPTSAFEGSVRLFDAQGNPVRGWVTAQESSVNYAPKEPLVPGTTYTFEVVAGGVADINGNTLAETTTITFTTAE